MNFKFKTHKNSLVSSTDNLEKYLNKLVRNDLMCSQETIRRSKAEAKSSLEEEDMASFLNTAQKDIN